MGETPILPDVAPRFGRVPVKMVGRLLDQLISVRVVVFAIHAPVVGPRHGVPQVTDHGVDEEELAVLSQSMPHEFVVPRQSTS